PALVINTGENNGNFYPSARLTKDQRQQLLGAKGYAEIRAEIEADTQRPAYQLQLNSLDAGLGTNVGRERYVKEKLGRDKIGAKGTDLSFEGVVKVGDKDYLVSVAEVKLLRLIKEAKENHYNGKLHLEPILSDDSKPSYDTLLEKPYLTDLIEAKAEIRTYKQVLTELGIETSSLVAKFYPSLDKETKQPTYKRPGSGSHGEWGFKFLRKSLDYKADSDTARVIAFYNGDGTNNSPDRYIVEWMLKHNVPLALVSTTKAGIDFKGGQIGAERLSDGRYRIRMLERGSTLDGKTPTEQTKVFEAMGLPGGLGEAGQQYFNTNIVLINYSLVAKLLQDLLKEVFSGDVQKLQTILAPDLIANTKKGPDGKDYIQLEGPIGTSLINLNNYFALNQDNSKVKEIMQRYNVEKMLRIINVDTQNRSRFFTPIKFATDHWFQAHSDYYRLNTDTWMLEDTQPGMTPPIFNLEDSYYQDVSNVYEAFGRASVTGLTSLTIKGKPVKLADAILEGDVEIENQTGREVDLNDLNVEPSATYSVDHFLNEAVVRQLWEGDDWATEMLEENQAKTVFNNKQSARNFLEAVKILFSSDKPVISAGAKKILEYKSLPSILEVFTEGEYSWLREMLDVSPYFGVKLLPYNTSPHDGKIWNTLKDGKFKSGDEGKVVVTKHDPFTLRLAYHKPLDLQAELRLIMRSKDHQEPLSLETARKVEEGEITFYEWDIATAKYDGFLEFEFFITDETKGFRLPVARRYYEYIDKILPESVPTNKIEYKPVESLKDAKVVVLSMEANLLNKEVRNKALFGAIAGGLGVLMGNHLRALRYSGATAYFPLPIYSKGSYQWMEGNQQKVDDNYPLDYSVLLNGYEDEYEKWERIRHIPVVFKLAGQETAALAILMKLTLKNEPGLPESYVLFIDRMVTSQDVEFKLVKDVLYPDHPTSEARFTQAAFYSRAVLGALEALDITPDILQVHESYPAAALVPDLFYNPEYNKNGRFKSAKNNLMGFAHTVVPQAFPKYNPKFLKDILDLELDEIALNELLTPQSKEKRLYDPFYALSKKAVSVGTVGLEHLRVMRKSFPDFASKYFAVEDANWPFFWMLDEQRKRGGELLNKEEMWQAKQNAAKRMHEYIKERSGITLRPDRPTIFEARRIADYKHNLFFTTIPGINLDGKTLEGIYYLTEDTEKGGLGFNLIVAGKAHPNDALGVSRANTLREYAKDEHLKDKFTFFTWSLQDSQVIIPGVHAYFQTSIPPYEAAGMQDKKSMVCYNVGISSLTGGPVQQITNVLHYGDKGNGYIFEPFDPKELQKAFEDYSARYWAYHYYRQGKSPEEIISPNQKWLELVRNYMKSDPRGILTIMQNAGRMLPITDSRLAAMKLARMYTQMLGKVMDYSEQDPYIAEQLKEFDRRLASSSVTLLSGSLAALAGITIVGVAWHLYYRREARKESSFLVLMATPEKAPFSKKGGLADVMGLNSLPHALAGLGLDIHVVTYLYDDIDTSLYGIEDTGRKITVTMGKSKETLQVFRKVASVDSRDITIYFLRHPIYSHKPYLEYIDKQRTKEEYDELIERVKDKRYLNRLLSNKDIYATMHELAFKQALALSKGTLELGRDLDLRPKVVHAHDWQTGLVPFLMAKDRRYRRYYASALKAYTVHNVAYQGIFGRQLFALLGLNKKEFNAWTLEFNGDINTMKAGLISSDRINTVSKSYAKEITTSAFGEGLEDVLAELDQQGKLLGIINGVNYREWNPETDDFLTTRQRYRSDDLSGKKEAKRALQKEFNLPQRDDALLFGAVARLTSQKGFDRLAEVIPMLIRQHDNVQFVVLGNGEPAIETALIKLQELYPQQISLRIGFDNRLAHLIEAGSDAFTMFSQFEPCGLSQLYSLKYGTLPVVFATGGLADTVIDKVTGFVFKDHSKSSVFDVMEQVTNTYFNQAGDWRQMVQNAMQQNYSWDSSARKYAEGIYGFIPTDSVIQNRPILKSSPASLDGGNVASQRQKQVGSLSLDKVAGGLNASPNPEAPAATVNSASSSSKSPRAPPALRPWIPGLQLA
ncbi:MAG: UTP--glucose-1-phosphate uridylyltransferase, partial [Candidatus Omnitrophica bacterium]|nr:UTP--glucose-1-phosphate uridylyltransferase [Candidatus Omnitrophota bacterium]